MVNLTFGNLLVFCMKFSLLPPSDVLSQCRKHLLCVCFWLNLQAFWNWVENYADEFTRLYQRPQADMAGASTENLISVLLWRGYVNLISLSLSVCVSECAEKLFDLVDSFAESTKRKAAVWPLQIILLILCPDITQDMSRDTSDDSKDNKASIHKLVHVYFSGSPLDHYCS